MRVLLTGAAGFVGTATAAELSRRGHEVVGVDAFIPQAHGRSTARPAAVHLVDVCDAEGLSAVLAGVDVVCHLAAMVGAGLTAADLPSYATHNDLGTAVLLAAMSERAVDRFVLASSMVVYGEGRYTCPTHGEQMPPPRARVDLDRGVFGARCVQCGGSLDWASVDEDARLDPRSGYAASKVAQEHYAAAWARQAPGAVIALRYHNVYGPGMPADTPYSGVAAMFRSAVERGEPPRVFEDGHQMRDFVHVDDVARANSVAVERVVAAPPETFAAYNVCSGRPVSIAEVARLIERGAGADVGGSGVEPVVTGEYRLGDVRHIVASPARATDHLGFTAEVPPEVGLPEFANAPLRGSAAGLQGS